MSIVIAPVTAIPYALVRLDEVRKNSTRTITIVISSQLMSGMEIWPAVEALVCSMRSRGTKPSWIACWVTENAPEITAWLAITVAMVARMTSGKRRLSGAIRKKGLCRICVSCAGPAARNIAPCPR